MHYYNYKMHEIKKLTYKQYSMLVLAMEQNMARERLLDFEISIVPKMNQKDREKVRKRYFKSGYPENFKEKHVAKNLDQLVNMLRSGLGG